MPALPAPPKAVCGLFESGQGHFLNFLILQRFRSVRAPDGFGVSISFAGLVTSCE